MNTKILMILLALLMILPFPQNVLADDILEDEAFVEVLASNNSKVSAQPPAVDAMSAIVMDMESGRVLYQKNASSQKAIASTTKVMTALLAIEKGNLGDSIIISKRAAGVGGSTVDLKAGQTFKLRELLYGLMLNSGNDAAIAIAEYIGGSVEGFAEMMNAKAKDLGAVNTNFRSPHGLDMPGHYSTAYDMALITRYALKNPTFSNLVGTKTAIFNGKRIGNTNELLGAYPGADGVKTGYTGQAGRCLIASATRDKWRIISVVLGSPTRSKRAQSSQAILDYTFGNYKPYTLLRKGDSFGKLPVIKGVEKEVEIKATEEICLPLKNDEINSMETCLVVPEKMDAPVIKGQEIGKVEFKVNGSIFAQSVVKAAADIRRKVYADYFRDILKGWSELVN